MVIYQAIVAAEVAQHGDLRLLKLEGSGWPEHPSLKHPRLHQSSTIIMEKESSLSLEAILIWVGTRFTLSSP
jgi:hypothetical protein